MLSLKNISKSFGKKTIFRDFTFKFKNSGIYIIKGKSGAGKTTLLRMIAGLDKDFEGEISGGGISLTSVCFQEHRLFPNLSAKENISKISFKYYDSCLENQVNGILSRLGFSENDMNLLPNELSGGMKQRVAFARAILRKAPILLLDEVTKELDAMLSSEVLEIIKEESLTRLVILITHKEEEIEKLHAEIINI